MLNFTPDAAAADNQGGGGYHTVKAGKWNATIVQVDLKNTKAGAEALFVRFQVQDDEATGLVFNCFNINHGKENVRDIAHRELSALCVATGITALTDPSQLDGKVVSVTIKHDRQGEPRINRYEPAAAAPAPTQESQAAAINQIADTDVPF